MCLLTRLRCRIVLPALFVLLVIIISPSLKAGEDIGKPPVVSIYDATFTEIDNLAVYENEPFILFGVAVGDVPLYYYWFESGLLVAVGNILADYSFAEPGDYTIMLEVVDCNGLSTNGSTGSCFLSARIG